MVLTGILVALLAVMVATIAVLAGIGPIARRAEPIPVRVRIGRRPARRRHPR